MKRIIESHQEDFFNAKNSEKYLKEAKGASKARFGNFLNTLKKLDIQGKYLEIGCGFFKSIRASYQPQEIKVMLNNIGIAEYKRKTIFPFFMQSLLLKKN